jgi:methyltransferase (TIGR00027 family)
MNGSEKKPASASGPLATVVYYIISVLLFPVSALGYIMWVVKAFGVKREPGVSGTAQGPLSARWLEHQLGTRLDEPANKLLMVVPGISRLGVQLMFGSILLAHRLSGYVPKAFRYPFEGDISIQVEGSARQTFFDQVVERYLAAGIPQFVILGAGFDTRALRLPRYERARSFEVDTPQMQAVKRELLKKAGIEAGRVTFAAADFMKDDWLVKLIEAGFDITQPALFIWEGVIMYLDRAAVESSLRKISGTAQGSLLAFDYFTSEVLESQAPYMRYARMGTRAAGEPLRFGVDSRPPSRERLAELLESCGLALVEQRTLGSETDGQRAWGGFAIANVK